MELPELKLIADQLGIKYRSDIKAETLQKRVAEYVPPEKADEVAAAKKAIEEANKPVEAVESKYEAYKNTGSVNVFTEGGRCLPRGTVQLTPDEALKYPSLEKC